MTTLALKWSTLGPRIVRTVESVRKHPIKYAAAIVFLIVASLPYLFMAGGGPEAPQDDVRAEDTLVIISPHRREVRLEYSRAFSQWMKRRHRREVRIRWLDVGGTSKVMKDLETRFATTPDAPGVDILFGGGVDPYLRAAERGWLARLSPPPEILDGIPPRCAGFPVYDPDGRWFGVAMSGFGILYNRPLLSRVDLPVPVTWEDLGSPEFASWVGSGDPRSSGSVHMCYEIILQAYGFERGWHLITRLCANVRRFGESGGTVPREVAAADVAAGMVIDQYAQAVIDAVGKDFLVFVLPRGLTMINPDAIGVLKAADHPVLAREFVNFVLSPAGQRILYQKPGKGGQRFSLHRLPVRRHLYDETGAPETNPYAYRGDFQYSSRIGSQRWRLVNDMIGTWLIDAHADLSAAWQAVNSAGNPADLVSRLCANPIPRTSWQSLSRTWKDPRRRLRTKSRWGRVARQRYRAVRRDALARRPDGRTSGEPSDLQGRNSSSAGQRE